MTRTRRTHEASEGASSHSRAPKLRRVHYYTRCRARRDALLGGNQVGRRNHVSDEMHWERMDILKPKPDVPSKALRIVEVDFNKEDNGKTHHTEEYEVDDLVVRRGHKWTLTLHFDRAVGTNTDVVVVQFAFGNQPKESKATILRLKLDLQNRGSVSSVAGKWTAQVAKIKGSSVHVDICPPANAMIGRYGVFVETQLTDMKNSVRRFELVDDEVIVLFNPWSPDDLVYMEDEDTRFEYVLNDHGRIWVGSALNNAGMPWNFGQFDNPVLEAALKLMDIAEIGDSARRSPITFVRAMSALANSNDNTGVLEGRWAETYPELCTLPWAWTGSVKILKEFMDAGKAVQFGQCWVFSGLMTSLLRSLGIPTRSVTNFESAHDTDRSMTIDSHFDEDNEPVTWMDDSVWNFHVWNESYFRRTDLPSGYDGWQAHDATPQELSEGVMRCGPAPLKAIKEGHVYLNYDIPFIFSEVNGDRVTWRLKKGGEMEVTGIDCQSIGKLISTKAVGSNHRQDLTLEYKYPDGSEEERKVAEFVNQFSSRSNFDIYDSDVTKDVVFELVLSESPKLGSDIQVSVKVKNTSSQNRTVQGRLTVLSSFYTGVPGKRVKGQRFEAQLKRGEERQLTMTLASKEYLSLLNPEASMQVYSSFKVTPTGQQFAKCQAFSLVKPSLQIELPDQVKAKTISKGRTEFTNPLSVSLTNAVLNLEGGTIISQDVHRFSTAIKPGAKVSFDFEICPRHTGRREVVASFTSDQLSGVSGSMEFRVK